MPTKIGDFLAETAHLTVSQVGAYHLLRMYYWDHCGLPAHEDAIRQISRMTPRQWSQSRDVLAALFDEGWRHPALDLEIQHAIEISKVNSANARKSHANRRKFAALSQTNSLTQPQLQQHSLPSGENRPLSPEVGQRVENPKSSAASRLTPDWTPNAADANVACGYGMSKADIESEVTKFRAHHAAKGTSSHDWSASWSMWCSRWDRRPVLIKPSISDEATGPRKVHVKMDTPQWEAWQKHLRKTTGKGSPSDKNFGWYFDSAWPPGHPVVSEGAAP
jgi:uncharacterized protein YdaU (DUF1376 family)